MRKKCKECPWIEGSKNEGYSKYLIENKESGLINSTIHRCHMIDQNSFDSDQNNEYIKPETNLCIGSVEHENNCKTI